jgi:hypothetical protein
MPEILATARTLLGDVRRSPYHNRIFCILDAAHGRTIRPQLERVGVSGQNIVVWEGNGIEFVYPEAMVREIFGTAGPLFIQDDCVSLNGITKRKKELADLVSAGQNDATEHRAELRTKLLEPFDRLLRT